MLRDVNVGSMLCDVLTYVIIVFFLDLVVVSSRYRCNDSITRENKPPSLPPRRVARPRSPWHDVPTNNSPVYGNFQDLGIIPGEKKEKSNEEPSEPTCTKQPLPSLGEWDQKFQDELLGTPRGFVYVQNKWKAAEKSGERCCDQRGNKGKSSPQQSPQKEMLPGKCSNTEEVEVKHLTIASNNNARSDIPNRDHKGECVLVENTGNFDICSDVQKEHFSAKIITNDFTSPTEELTAKDGDLSDTCSQMVDNELSCENEKRQKVPKDSTEFEFNVNLKGQVECTKTEHSNKRDERIVNNISGNQRNFNLNATQYEDTSNDTSVTLRKSQNGMMGVCNRNEILFNETERCLALVNSENDTFSSSQCHNVRDSKGMKEGTKEEAHITDNDCLCSDSSSISTDSLVPEEIKTSSNTPCNQNIQLNGMANGLSDRALDRTETAEYKDTTPHLHRHSDELNLLLAQLAEITSAPLLPHGEASSLVDIPEARKPEPQANEPSQLGLTQQESVQTRTAIR
jgi:hypothetical protein